jgi:LysR family transcriptional regulator, glycine cleavage system transcriptional activator
MRDRLRQPTLNAVRAFETAARLGSLKAAATELGVTSSAISHQVRQLEAEIGKRLFIRHNNAIELTAEGHLLFEEIRPALRTIARATEAIRRDTTTVAMNVTTWFALHWLIPRLADFQTRYPRIAIEMTAVQRPVVLNDSVELIISYARETPPVAGTVELLKDFAQPMAAPGLWHDDRGRVLDIRKVPLIGSTVDDYDWRAFAADNKIEFEQLRVAYRFDTDAAVIAACRAGLGVAIIPTESGRRDIEAGHLAPFGSFRERCFGVYWLATAPRLRRPAQLFVNWLVKVAPGVQPRNA